MVTCSYNLARELLLSRTMNTRTSKRFVGEVVALSRDCELGQEGDRAVVTALVDHYMTLTFLDRGPDCSDVYTGADYKYLRAYEGVVDADLTAVAMKARAKPKVMERAATLRELRDLVATYLEGSDDAPRAAELLDVLEPLPSMLSDTFCDRLKSAVKELADEPTADRDNEPTADRDNIERAMFGCASKAIDQALARKDPRDIAMYAMTTLSDAQELIGRGAVSERDANTIRQRMNIAKYAIDKAVPR